MKHEELIEALLRLGRPEPSRCQGCGYEHSCNTRGCAIINTAAARLSACVPILRRLLVEEKCIACGATIPEGRMVCPICEGIQRIDPSGWISMGDALPTEGTWVLVAYSDGFVNMIKFKERSALFTYWMPLPNPPKEVR